MWCVQCTRPKKRMDTVPIVKFLYVSHVLELLIKHMMIMSLIWKKHDAIFVSSNTIVCSVGKRILIYSSKTLICQKSIGLKTAKYLSVDKNGVIVIAAKESVYSWNYLRKDWKRLIYLPDYEVRKAIMVTSCFPHKVLLIARKTAVENFKIYCSSFWYLLQCICEDNGNVSSVTNTEMMDYEGNPILVNDMAWDYEETIFITESEKNRVHIYDLNSNYQEEMLVENGSFNYPQGIAYDINKGILYLGQNHGHIMAYEKAGIKTRCSLQFTF